MRPRAARRRAPAPSAKPWFSLNGSAEISAAEARLLRQLAWISAGILAVALLAMVFGPHRVGDYFTETDFYGAYAEGAKLIQHGRLLPSRYGVIGPGYEIALALVGFVIRDLFLAAELLSVAAAAAILLLWFHLLERRAGPRVGFFAVLFLITNGTFFHYGYSAVTDAPAIALQAAALYALLARSGNRAPIGAGLLAGLAFLTRYNAVYLLPAGLVAILAGATAFERRGGAALRFAAGFFAPVVPWVLYSLAHGSGFSFQLHHNIAYEVFARAKGIPWDDYQKNLQPQFKNLWDVIARDPGAVTRRMLFNVWDHLRRDAAELLGWPVAIAAVLGLALGWREGTLGRLWPLLLGAILLFLSLVPVFYSTRYSLALLPFYVSLAAIAFASPIVALALGRRRPLWIKPLVAGLPLVLAVLASVKTQARVIDQLPVEVLPCAETLRELKVPGDRVMARKWHIAYHAGVEPLAFPFAGTLPELARYAHENHARWLYFSWPEAETRPQFSYLIDTSGAVPGLTPRRVMRPHPAVLYEIGPEFGRLPAWFSNDTLVAWHRTFSRIMIEGQKPNLLYNMGGIYWTMGRLEDARRMLELAVRADPRYFDALLMLGNVLVRLGDMETARAAYQRAQAIDPGNIEPRLMLGWASLAQGRLEETAAEWRPLISATRNPATLTQMVQLYRRLGDHAAEAEAAATLQRLGGAR